FFKAFLISFFWFISKCSHKRTHGSSICPSSTIIQAMCENFVSWCILCCTQLTKLIIEISDFFIFFIIFFFFLFALWFRGFFLLFFFLFFLIIIRGVIEEHLFFRVFLFLLYWGTI